MKSRVDVAEAIRLAREGWTPATIAGRYGVTTPRIHQLFAKHGTSAQALRNDAIRQAAEEGLTRGEAAERLSISPQHVSKLARSMGVAFAHAGPGAHRDLDRLRKVIRCAEAGLTTGEAGALLGCTGDAVRHFALRAGVRMKSAKREARKPPPKTQRKGPPRSIPVSAPPPPVMRRPEDTVRPPRAGERRHSAAELRRRLDLLRGYLANGYGGHPEDFDGVCAAMRRIEAALGVEPGTTLGGLLAEQAG